MSRPKSQKASNFIQIKDSQNTPRFAKIKSTYMERPIEIIINLSAILYIRKTAGCSAFSIEFGGESDLPIFFDTEAERDVAFEELLNLK